MFFVQQILCWGQCSVDNQHFDKWIGIWSCRGSNMLFIQYYVCVLRNFLASFSVEWSAKLHITNYWMLACISAYGNSSLFFRAHKFLFNYVVYMKELLFRAYWLDHQSEVIAILRVSFYYPTLSLKLLIRICKKRARFWFLEETVAMIALGLVHHFVLISFRYTGVIFL